MALRALDPKHVGRFGFKWSLGLFHGVHSSRLIGGLHKDLDNPPHSYVEIVLWRVGNMAMCGEISVESSTKHYNSIVLLYVVY